MAPKVTLATAALRSRQNLIRQEESPSEQTEACTFPTTTISAFGAYPSTESLQPSPAQESRAITATEDLLLRRYWPILMHSQCVRMVRWLFGTFSTRGFESWAQTG